MEFTCIKSPDSFQSSLSLFFLFSQSMQTEMGTGMSKFLLGKIFFATLTPSSKENPNTVVFGTKLFYYINLIIQQFIIK